MLFFWVYIGTNICLIASVSSDIHLTDWTLQIYYTLFFPHGNSSTSYPCLLKETLNRVNLAFSNERRYQELLIDPCIQYTDYSMADPNERKENLFECPLVCWKSMRMRFISSQASFQNVTSISCDLIHPEAVPSQCNDHC